MPEIIDSYSHILPEAVFEKLVEIHPHDEVTNLKNATRLMDVDNRIADMEDFGVDRQVLTLAHPPIWEGLPDEDAIEVMRLANDEIQRIADEHPDTFIPVATIPNLTGEFVDEVERCVNELDMVGVQVFTNMDGKLLDDEDFYPFYEAVNDVELPIWIHPQLYEWHDYEVGATWLYKMMGWPFETSVVVARLLFNGVLEEYENLELVTHHMGGAMPYWVGRIHSWYRTRREEPEMYTSPEMADLSQPLEAYFDRIYADTAVSCTGEEYPFRCGYEFFGEDNVLYGADYPFGPDKGKYWPRETIPMIENSDIPDSSKRKIFSENLERLIER